MALTLEAIILNENMRWLEQHQSVDVAQSVRRVIGGSSVLFAGPHSNGINITLEATNEFGWAGLTKAVVDSLEVLAAVPGASYTLTIGLEVFTVAFRHDDPPAIDLTPIVHRIDEELTDFYIGQLKFITR